MSSKKHHKNTHFDHFFVHIFAHGQFLARLDQFLLEIGPGSHLDVADARVIELCQQILQFHVLHALFFYLAVELGGDL